jgi:hypothetical protein
MPVHGPVVMPGVIERPGSEPPGPVEALRRLLAGQALAPHLLSEARHRAVVARESGAAAIAAARRARDAELAHELAVRNRDPRGRRHLHLWFEVVAVGLLLALCWAAAFALTRQLAWPDRLVFPLAAVGLGGALAWRVSVSRDRGQRHHPIILLAAAWAAALVILGTLTAVGGLLLSIAVALTLGAVLLLAGGAMVCILDHGEGWRCFRFRRAADLVARHRREAQEEASRDEAAAQAAVAAWESLVVEECQLAHPADDADRQTWLADCVSLARRLATPE